MPPPLTISSYLFARWHLFRHVGYLSHQQQVDLWPFDLESGVRDMCDVGYLCANFSLPIGTCSRVTPHVRDRQTSDRQTSDIITTLPGAEKSLNVYVHSFRHRTTSWRTNRTAMSWSCCADASACWRAIKHGSLDLTINWQILTNIHGIWQNALS